MRSCCFSCLKYMVAIVNLLFMLLGTLLLGVTLWMYYDGATYAPIAADMHVYNYVLYFFMGVGAAMTIVGFLGCCGALQESQCMLASFFAFVLVIFAGEVAAGVWAVANNEKFESIAAQTIADSFQHDYGVNDKKTEAFDTLQRELKCCGSTGPKDWAKAHFNNGEIGVRAITGPIGAYSVPESCCDIESSIDCDEARSPSVTSFTAAIKPDNGIYNEGCTTKMIRLLKKHMWITLSMVGVAALIEILAMIFSIVLCCAVRRIDEFKA